MPDTLITPLASYRNERPYPFCPGCGHGSILDRLNEALVRLELDPRRVVIVSDIGCSGLSDQYFATSAFHGLHGRSITYASGIKLARPELEVIVVMGDGGTGIGGAHLLAAARRNVGITVIVFNNLNFGMTGGQHSTTTPAGAVTSTTRGGNLERPLDVCATVGVNGASYVWRGTSFDQDLAERLAEAIHHPGFSLLDVWELCTAYYVPANQLNRKTLLTTLKDNGFSTGVLYRRDLPEYAEAYREAHALFEGQPRLAPRPLRRELTSGLDRRFRLVVAGSAGEKVRTAVRLAGRAAILSGLWVTQRDDYPITVQSGHSVSQLVLAPEEIEYTGVSKPDALLLLSEDGRKKAAGDLARMDAGDRVFVLPELADVQTAAPVTVVELESQGSPEHRALVRGHRSTMALAAVLRELALFPVEALEIAAGHDAGERTPEIVKAVETGLGLACHPWETADLGDPS